MKHTTAHFKYSRTNIIGWTRLYIFGRGRGRGWGIEYNRICISKISRMGPSISRISRITISNLGHDFKYIGTWITKGVMRNTNINVKVGQTQDAIYSRNNNLYNKSPSSRLEKELMLFRSIRLTIWLWFLSGQFASKQVTRQINSRRYERCGFRMLTIQFK